MRKIAILTGAGMSVESGLSTFRDSGGLWDNYPVERVATHDAWEREPDYVNEFYNKRRQELVGVSPNEGHRLVAALEREHDVTVITQNVDNLHELAGSSRVIHLHGELMKVCSSRDVDDPRHIVTLAPPNLRVEPGQLAGDGSRLRPYIVFFGEAVPNISVAADVVSHADTLVIIGTSLNVYPAAGLVAYAKPEAEIYLIDPKPVNGQLPRGTRHIVKGASEGMRELVVDVLGMSL